VQAFAAAEPVAPAAPGTPVFRSLFHTSEPRGAVSPVVADLWTAPKTGVPEGGVASLTGASAPARPGMPLDLFQESAPNVRGLFDGKA
jgi:hypothetical protein